MTVLRLVAENVAELTTKESLIRMRIVMEMLRTCPYGKMQKAFEAKTKHQETGLPGKIISLGEIKFSSYRFVIVESASHPLNTISMCSF